VRVAGLENSKSQEPYYFQYLFLLPAANSGYFEDVAPGSERYVYFWISIPVGQWAGTYTNNVYIKAVKDGTIP
jgi:hypothetical protein